MNPRSLTILIAFCFSTACSLDAQATDVLTQRNDNSRTGAQLHETILTPANVRPATFGRLYERQVQGQIITQPLYAGNLTIPGKGSRNVVYVATRKNWIYAFDADDVDPNPTHGLVWSSPVQIEPAAPVPGMCPETYGPVGITSTPVINRAAQAMYAVARKSDGSIWLHALDITTGAPKAGTPGAVRISASLVNAEGHTIVFNQALELNRAALLLSHGIIYMAFGALNCDNAGWRGWVLAYRADNLAQVGAFATVSSTAADGGGIWQSGSGLVADSAGDVYFETGNGPVQGTRDYGESFIKLHTGPAPSYGLTVAGHYTVTNHAALNGGDTDLGSGGPTLLPGGRLIGGGKQGKLYVFDTNTMLASQNPPAPGPVPPGGSDGFQAFLNTWHDNSAEIACTTVIIGRKCFVSHPRYETGEGEGPNIHGGPIYWGNANPAFGLIYEMPEKDHLRAFRYNLAAKTVNTSPSAVSGARSPDGMPGSYLALSANGGTNGVLWALIPKSDGQWQNVPGSLVAFDALTLAELWRDDDDIAFSKFTPPMVAGGKVFRPTFADKLIVYGLRSGPAVTPCYDISQKYQNYTGPDGILGDPTIPESITPGGAGHFRHYSRGGSIYWTPSTCAQVVVGAIRGKWSTLGWETSFLGFPTTDETVTPDGVGRYNHFQGGSIYWTPTRGAYEVHGSIRSKWAELGWERSPLGYPVSDETEEIDGSGRFSLFEHGSIHWKQSTGVVTVDCDPAKLVGPGQGNIDRPGSDLANFDLPSANPALCEQRCTDNASCQAWTYVNPGVQSPSARCWLKNAMPLPVASACCTSGLKVLVNPPVMHSLLGAVDRPGSDFANFDLPMADYRLCQGECAANGTCRAWTYVEPGHCWLKNAVPAPVINQCCISGSK